MPKRFVYRTGRRLLVGSLMVAAACRGDRSTLLEPRAPGLEPEFAISDGAHSAGTPGFFFLPPMVSNPGVSGILDDDIAFVNPVVVICDVTDGPDVDCGASVPGATPPVRSFTVTSDPAISVDSDKYSVNWDTGEPGFAAGRTYRVHVLAGPARRELGFADVLLTTEPGKAKNTKGDVIVLNDGRTLPIHFRIEKGVVLRP